MKYAVKNFGEKKEALTRPVFQKWIYSLFNMQYSWEECGAIHYNLMINDYVDITCTWAKKL